MSKQLNRGKRIFLDKVNSVVEEVLQNFKFDVFRKRKSSKNNNAILLNKFIKGVG